MSKRKLARRISASLFTDGRGQHYQHLSLDDADNLGWGEGAVTDIIESELKKSEKEKHHGKEAEPGRKGH